jgi:hypothetical protein
MRFATGLNCVRDACEGHYNRCLQRRMQNQTTGVNSSARPATTTRRPE